MSPLICYDLRFPELFEIASERADLIVVPANWPSDRREHFMTLLKARAIEDQCYIAGVNRVGRARTLSYSGDSMIVDPFGRVLSKAGDGEELIVAGFESGRAPAIPGRISGADGSKAGALRETAPKLKKKQERRIRACAGRYSMIQRRSQAQPELACAAPALPAFGPFYST